MCKKQSRGLRWKGRTKLENPQAEALPPHSKGDRYRNATNTSDKEVQGSNKGEPLGGD
jgi:hypothetical protein